MCMWDSLCKLKSQLQNLLNKLIAVLLTVQYCGRVGLFSSFVIIQRKVQKLPPSLRKESACLQNKTTFSLVNKQIVLFFFVLNATVCSPSMMDFM